MKSGSKLALLKIPFVLIIGYMVGVGQLAMGFIDVALAVHLQQVRPHVGNSLTKYFKLRINRFGYVTIFLM